jgi:hypothetical protein
LPPKNLRITINNSDVIVNFSIDNTTTNLLPTSFIILLAQYDINKKNTGNNNLYLSNETILNPGLKSSNIETHTCTITDGIPQCKYIFNDVESKDENNNLYYYKVGVAAIYSNGESNYATPYNISNPDKMFTLDTSLNNQNKLVPSNTIKPITPNTISTADGKYELIKSQLGNYPDNLLLDTQTINNNSLSDLVDKSMAQALLNVNIST